MGLRKSGEKLEKGITNGHEGTLRDDSYFNYLDGGYVSQVHKYVRIYHLYHK